MSNDGQSGLYINFELSKAFMIIWLHACVFDVPAEHTTAIKEKQRHGNTASECVHTL